MINTSKWQYPINKIITTKSNILYVPCMVVLIKIKVELQGHREGGFQGVQEPLENLGVWVYNSLDTI